MKILSLMPWADWLALLTFFALWVGYATFSRGRGLHERTLLATTNQLRMQWMMQATAREPRMLDGIITQNLSHTPSFFSSTTIIIIGGLFAVLGTTDKAAELVREIPFAQQTPLMVFEFKVLVLVGVCVVGFCRLTWARRQYTVGALLVGAMPPANEFEAGLHDREWHARRDGVLVGTAAETFNDGLRAYYFSFGAMAWFFSPLALVIATALVVLILYGREFRSDVVQRLRD